MQPVAMLFAWTAPKITFTHWYYSTAPCVSHLVEEMKRNSSRWIKTLGRHYEEFAWQGGYAAFYVSQPIVEKTKNYIANQVEHNKKKSFKDEYLDFLRLYNIDYDERYVLSD